MDISSGERFAFEFKGHTITGEIERASAPERVEWVARRARALSEAPARERIMELKEDPAALADYLEGRTPGALFDLQVTELVGYVRSVEVLTVDQTSWDASDDRAKFVRCMPHGLRRAALNARFDTDPLSDAAEGNSERGPTTV